MKKSYQNNIKDPVCGMSIKPGMEKHNSLWKGDSYYFCASHCKKTFEESPEKYLKKRSWFRQKWDRYLEKLNKQTGGKPPSCC